MVFGGKRHRAWTAQFRAVSPACVSGFAAAGMLVAAIVAGLLTACGVAAAADSAGGSSEKKPAASQRAAAKANARTKKAGPMVIQPDRPTTIEFPAAKAKFVRFLIRATVGGEPCLDELEIYAPGGKQNLALASAGAKATASSCLPGYPIHQIAHLNDGQYGNDRSWIAATSSDQWAQIELPQAADVALVVFSRDRKGGFRDRIPTHFEIQLSSDGRQWTKVREVRAVASAGGGASATADVELSEPFSWEGLLQYAFLCERATWETMSRDDHLSPHRVDRPALPGGKPYWGELARLDAPARVLRQLDDMLDRFAAKGLDVTKERAEAERLRRELAAMGKAVDRDPDAQERLYLHARLVKRSLFFRDPDLAPLERVLFVRRHPYTPSHNYSDILDSAFRPGGGVCVLSIPRRDGRLEPREATIRTLFDASRGIARDAVAGFDASQVYFAYRPSDQSESEAYWHLMSVGVDGSGVRRLTSGPFNDYYPCPLPDGGLGFISTRCRARFLCWRPQAFVLFRMETDGSGMLPLSHANLSEWAPTVMRDGRILWTRSEYLDKGADFGHTLWAIHPDGTHPTMLYGNNSLNCYMNAHEVPGTSELCVTLISHGGDLNGPIGLVDISKGPFHRDAITNIAPDTRPHYHMSWAGRECFRDPVPISRDYFLAGHAPADRFGLYAVDRWGNREVLYFDPAMASMSPTLLRPVPRPPVLSPTTLGPTTLSPTTLSPTTLSPTTLSPTVLSPTALGPTVLSPTAAMSPDQMQGQFFVADVYRGLEPAVKRGTVKYLRVCQEMRSDLERLPSGAYRNDHEAFQDFYASPTHIVTGPYGWPSYVAKASLGIVPVEEDGSVSFYAPAGKVLYFEVLDAQFNEIQRMRSVVQLQPGEKRSCIGCHENRTTAPQVRPVAALRPAPRRLEVPSWGAVAFSYEKVVQPVWDAKCVRCHDAKDKQKLDLSGTLDRERIPASYRTLISQGWVHYFDLTWGREHQKAAPLSFGTVQSRLWKTLNAGHYDVKLTTDEMHRVKCWTDLNCPLWPDYQYRLNRPGPAVAEVKR